MEQTMNPIRYPSAVAANVSSDFDPRRPHRFPAKAPRRSTEPVVCVPDGRVDAQGRVVRAHFGNGASTAAVRGGHGIDCPMGFTLVSGLPMGTRFGDIAPGLAIRLERVSAWR